MDKRQPTHTKEQLVASKKYRKYRDILAVALDARKVYTAAEVDSIVAEFLSRPVKN